jgi:putative redox protein
MIKFQKLGEKMVDLSESLVEQVKRRMQYIKEHQTELKPWTVTVSVKKEDGFLSSASRQGSDIVWYSDESKDRGGTGKGPSPLSYFMSSLGFCQMVHYVEHCSVENLELDSLDIKVEGKISPQKPVRFTDVTYEVQIRSGESDERVKDLARKAAEDCYVTNTLRRSSNVNGIIFHNGNKIDEHH